jgi:hypothetical protein
MLYILLCDMCHLGLDAITLRGEIAILKKIYTTISFRSPSDYAIICGGTFGLGIAIPLCEDSDIEVFMLQAGKDLPADPRTVDPTGLGHRFIRKP